MFNNQLWSVAFSTFHGVKTPTMANMKLPYEVNQLTNFLKIKNWSHKPVQALLQHTIAHEEQLFGIYSFQFLQASPEGK